MEVLGMHCSACSSAVEAALEGTPGVQRASVSLTLRMAEITYDPRLADTVSSSPLSLCNLRPCASSARLHCPCSWAACDLLLEMALLMLRC